MTLNEPHSSFELEERKTSKRTLEATKKFTKFPKKFNALDFNNYFDEIEKSLMERSKLKNQDNSKVMLLLIALNELKQNKFHMDSKRSEANIKGKTVGFVSETSKLMKNLQFIYEALIEQDQIHVDTKSLAKISNYLIRVVESILTDKFSFSESDLSKFQNSLRAKAPDLDAFVLTVIKTQ